MTKVHQLAEAYDKTLKATDFDSNTIVLIRHGDGTSYEFHDAFMMVLKDPRFDYAQDPGQKWVLVFTEHQGFHVFHEGDLDRYGEYQRVSTERPFPKESVHA